jgi:imidazolonepropionase-like amidohydrolase
MFSCTPAGESADPIPHNGCGCCTPQVRSIARRIERELTRRGFIAGVGASLASFGFSPCARAQAADAARPIVFSNFLLFDGKSRALKGGLRLLVEAGRIKALATDDFSPPAQAQAIDCGGRTLMPGLIDAHWHTILAGLPISTLLTADIGYILLAAADEAERALMRGFTTVRDLGGPAFSLKQAIDDGLAIGPRIYPSGAMITSSGGHGDLRPVSDLPRDAGGAPTSVERSGAVSIADGADQMRLRVREQLIQGASQIKLTGSGGVSSPRTTLDMVTLSEGELRAAVETAADRQAYVAVHAYPSTAIERAVTAGVQCIEHGHLMDDATARLIADKGVWLSTQPFLSEEDTGPLSGQSRLNALRMFAGTDSVYALAKEYKIKTAFGADLLFSPALARRQGMMLTHLARWYDNADILRMATSANGELLALSGPRNPYPGKLGVIEEGALADLLVVDGNPLDDIGLMANPEKSLLIIMKDGKLSKDARPSKAE